MTTKFSQYLMANPSGPEFDRWWEQVQSAAKAAGKPIRADLKEWSDIRSQYASGKSPADFVRWWTK